MDTNSLNNSSYTLRQLFEGKMTMVIPDIQRDYCWGEPSLTSPHTIGKVTTFVSTLIYLYTNRTPTTLGLMYGYEYPAGSQHIHIIDGQQRLTTLYLLIGMLYRRTSREDLRRLLISDYKLIDDHSPRLLYQVRSEAMYFMSDLVTNFFLDRNGRLSMLEKSPWYFSSYDTDPTIQNFINAIRSIDEVIEMYCQSHILDFDKFADYVADNLLLYYHDLGSRAAAEKMFIRINTTGEPLSPAQNLKSYIAAIHDDPKSALEKWEDVNEWCWTHRPQNSEGVIHTSDTRFTQLLNIWHEQCNKDILQSFSPKNFDLFHLFFKTFCRLIECEPRLIDADSSSPKDMFRVLPMISYLEKWPHATDMQISQMAHFLDNITRYQRLSPLGNDHRTAQTMMNSMPKEDLTSFLYINGPYAKYLNTEELAKLDFLNRAEDKDHALQLIYRAESHPMLYGNVHKVIQWCTTKGTDYIDVKRMSLYIDLIYKVWGTNIDGNSNLDLLRRALLTLRHKGFPILRKSDTVISMCWHDYDWQRLLSTSPGAIRQLLDRILSKNHHPSEAMKQMCASFSDTSYPYFFIIKRPEVLSGCARRTFMRPYPAFIGYHTALQNGDQTSIWHIGQTKVKADTQIWGEMRAYGSRCLYIDHRTVDISIEVFFCVKDKTKIELFSRYESDPWKRSAIDINRLVNRLPAAFYFDKKRKRYISKEISEKEGALLLNTILAVSTECYA